MTYSNFTGVQLFPETSTPRRKTWTLALPLMVMVFILFGQVFALVPVMESGLIAEENLERYPEILYMLTAAFGAGFLLCFAWSKWFEGRGADSLGLTLSRGSFTHLLAGYFCGLALVSLIVLLIWALGGYQIQGSAFRFNLAGLTLLALAFVVQSSVEEIVFRGWLFGRLSERFGVYVGIVGNAAVFLLLHTLGVDVASWTGLDWLLSVGGLVIFSVFASVLVLFSGNVWSAAGWHAAWNWFFIAGYGVPTTGLMLDLAPIFTNFEDVADTPVWLTGGERGPEGSVIMLLTLTAASLLILHLRKKKARSASR